MIQYREDGHFIPYRSQLQCLQLSKINLWYPNIAQIFGLNINSLIQQRFSESKGLKENKRPGQHFKC